MTAVPAQPAYAPPAPPENAGSLPEVLAALQPLTEAERLDARDRARQHVMRLAGPRPARDQFRDYTASEYPRWLTLGVGAMLVIVFAAAANVSVFRLFTAGRDHFLESIGIEWQAAIVGASSFLLAEFMVIAATIALRIYFKGRDRWLMAVPIGLGLLMAFVGNWAISQPQVALTAAGLWSILETATPPAAVLFMAVIGERLILESLRNRHRNEQAFQAALADWQQATAEPERSPAWRRSYANALKEAIREANGSGRGQKERRELMAALRGPEWAALVLREMQADRWFEEAIAAQAADALHPADAQHPAGQEVASATNFTRAGIAPQSPPLPGQTTSRSNGPLPGNGALPSNGALTSNGNGRSPALAGGPLGSASGR